MDRTILWIMPADRVGRIDLKDPRRVEKGYGRGSYSVRDTEVEKELNKLEPGRYFVTILDFTDSRLYNKVGTAFSWLVDVDQRDVETAVIKTQTHVEGLY